MNGAPAPEIFPCEWSGFSFFVKWSLQLQSRCHPEPSELVLHATACEAPTLRVPVLRAIKPSIQSRQRGQSGESSHTLPPTARMRLVSLARLRRPFSSKGGKPSHDSHGSHTRGNDLVQSGQRRRTRWGLTQAVGGCASKPCFTASSIQPAALLTSEAMPLACGRHVRPLGTGHWERARGERHTLGEALEVARGKRITRQRARGTRIALWHEGTWCVVRPSTFRVCARARVVSRLAPGLGEWNVVCVLSA